MVRLLTVLAISLSIIGVIVFATFMIALKTDYTLFGGKVLVGESGQVGDFIGGIVGSIWAFAGVLLYFLAVQLQGREIRNQAQESQINRATTMVYNEVARFETRLASTEFFLPNNTYQTGISGVYALNQFITGRAQGITDLDSRPGRNFEEGHQEEEYNLIERNCNDIIQIFDSLNNLLAIGNAVINQGNNEASREQLRELLRNIIGREMVNFTLNINKIVANRLSREQNQLGGLIPDFGIHSIMNNLLNLSRRILDQLETPHL